MTTRQTPPQRGTDMPESAGTGSAMPVKLCATPTLGSTRNLPKNKRDGNEVIQPTPRSVKRSDKQRTKVRTLNRALKEGQAQWDTMHCPRRRGGRRRA